jgi:hypothetical protein
MTSIDDPDPTRREFGIAAHLQRTTRADCIRNPFTYPLELLGFGTFVAVVIETLEQRRSQSVVNL